MRREDSPEPAVWFRTAEDDLVAAQVLLAHDGPPGTVAFHLQQAIEKALKGFLLSRGWGLRRLHDLDLLLSESLEHDGSLERYADLCDALDGFYVGGRYPSVGAPAIDEEALTVRAAEAEGMVEELKRLAGK